jgi:type I restriction enzyme, S subunit
MSDDKLPPGWCVEPIGDVCADCVAQAAPGVVPLDYIDIGSIDRSRKLVGATEKVTSVNAPTRARQRVRQGDVLVSMTRPNLNAVALVPKQLDGAVASTGFDVLRPIYTLPEWLFFRVRSNEFIEDVCAGLQGVVYPAIRPRDVRRHRLPIPPVPEQRRIVEAVESHFTRLDDAVATLERVRANLKRYRASVLKATVEGRLVPIEAELARAEGRDYEPATQLLKRILVERRRRWEEIELARVAAAGKTPKDARWKARYEEPTVLDTSSLPDLPEGWCWASLHQLLGEPLCNGRSVPDAADGFPVLRLTALKGGRLDLSERKTGAWTRSEAEPYFVQRRDFLVARGNGSIRLVGRGGLVDVEPDEVAYPDTLIRVRLASPIDADYFAQIWNSAVIRSQVERKAKTTAGIHKVNQHDLESCAVPLPPQAEAARIREALSEALSVVDAADATVELDLRRLARLRQSILRWAFEGKLVDQDASDQPASVLLERIKTERMAAETNDNGRRRSRRSVKEGVG